MLMMLSYVCYLNRTLTRNFAAVTGGTEGGSESPLLHLPPGRGEVPLESPSAGAPAVHARDPAVGYTSGNHAQHPSGGSGADAAGMHAARGVRTTVGAATSLPSGSPLSPSASGVNKQFFTLTQRLR